MGNKDGRKTYNDNFYCSNEEFNSLLIWRLVSENFWSHPLGLRKERSTEHFIRNKWAKSMQLYEAELWVWDLEIIANRRSGILTVPAVDLEDKNVLCFKRDNPKSQTWKVKSNNMPCLEIRATQPPICTCHNLLFIVNYLYLDIHRMPQQETKNLLQHLSPSHKPAYSRLFPSINSQLLGWF